MVVKAVLEKRIYEIFRGSFIVSLIALIIAFVYAGWNGLFITLILAVLEISLSMDNAIVMPDFERMSSAWQKTFLTLEF
ncbi:hypothetical protein ICE98_00553 [Lactococcus lactis]|nr:hypothetical protein [Lactococcus lactis]